MFVALSCIHILNKTYMFLDVSVTKFMYNVFPNLMRRLSLELSA